MWLSSRDERRLLRYYHKNRDQVGKESNYSLDDLVLVLYCRNMEEVSDHIKRKSQRKTLEDLKENIQRYLDESNRVRSANEALKQRGLVILTPKDDSQLITLSLTAQGDDLGRKYSSWWTRSGLWFAEYRHHWIWLIVSFLGGIIGALLVNWLSNGNK